MTRREQATRDVSLADSLLRQAADLRGDAERDCARDIENALEDSGLKNTSFWQKAGDWLKTTFTTWDGFVRFCENVSMVLGVVALFLSGPLTLRRDRSSGRRGHRQGVHRGHRAGTTRATAIRA